MTELNKQLKTPIEESDKLDMIATLKYMVGAVLDVWNHINPNSQKRGLISIFKIIRSDKRVILEGL